jgi:hypothetical protein
MERCSLVVGWSVKVVRIDSSNVSVIRISKKHLHTLHILSLLEVDSMCCGSVVETLNMRERAKYISSSKSSTCRINHVVVLKLTT